MMFASKIAKLGKAQHINCNQISNNPTTFNVYVSNKNVGLKTLQYNQNNYDLSKQALSYNYTEIIGINSNFILARNGEYFSLLKVQNGS